MFLSCGAPPRLFLTYNFEVFVFCRYHTSLNALYPLSPFWELKSYFLFTKNLRKKTIFRLKNRKNVTFSEFFSKPGVWTKVWRFPFFPTRYDRSCSNFFISTSIELGCMFFCLTNVVRAKFGRFYKISTIEKNTFIDGVFSILVLLDHRNREQYFSNKKNTSSICS